MTLAVLASAIIPYVFQQAMVIPALPVLRRDLHTTQGWVTWVFTGYLLMSVVATPLVGKLGDQYGKSRVLLLALIVFFLGSIGATLATNIWALIACRIFQGSAAGIFPLTFAIIKDMLPAEKVSIGMGLVSAISGIGGGAGIVLSGVIIDHLSWRFLFGFAAIGTAILIVLVYLLIPESPVKARGRLDVPGATLLSGGLLCCLLALTQAGEWGWGSTWTVTLFAAAPVFLVAWVLTELHAPQPMVDIRMLIGRTILLTNIANFLSGFSVFASALIIPSFLQTPRGLAGGVASLVHYGFDATPTQTGLYLIPGSVVGIATGVSAGFLARSSGPRPMFALGMALSAAGPASLAVFHDRPWEVVLGLVINGAGAPIVYAAAANLVVSAVRPTETGIASSMTHLCRTIGFVVGGQAGAAILTTETIARTGVPTESAFVTAFLISAVTAALGTLAAVFVLPMRRQRLALAGALEPPV